ncbi:MAG: hypothetical protein J7L82_02340 [Staphylothermus sp.]|nr:hypothetical protein [Staphylothermus sp.]
MTLNILAEVERRRINDFEESSKQFKEMILHYIAAPPFMLKARIPYRAAIVVGPMNSGKTSFVEALLGKAVKKLLNYGIDENEIAYVHSYERNISEIVGIAKKRLELKKLKYFYLFNDDAIAASAGNARLSFTPEAVGESQYYTMIRHRLAKKGFNGFLFVFHATQVFSLLEKTFRSTSDLYLFKYYPMEPADIKLIGQMVGKAGMIALAEISYKLRTPRTFNDFLEGVYSAVARLIKSKRLVKAYDKDPATDTNRYKAILSNINNITIEPGPVPDEEPGAKSRSAEKQYRYVRKFMRFLLETGAIRKKGKRAYLEFYIKKEHNSPDPPGFMKVTKWYMWDNLKQFLT